MSDIWTDDWSSKPTKESAFNSDIAPTANYEIEDKTVAASYKPQVRVMRRDPNSSGTTPTNTTHSTNSSNNSNRSSGTTTPQQKDLEELRKSKQEALATIHPEALSEYRDLVVGVLSNCQSQCTDLLLKAQQSLSQLVESDTFRGISPEQVQFAIGAGLITSVIMLRKFWPFGSSSDSNNSVPPPDHIFIKLGKSQYRLSFEPKDYLDPENGVTVGFLREKVKETLLKKPSDQSRNLTLIFSGKKLSNDKATLKDYGVVSGDKILCTISKKLAPAGPAAPPPVPKTPKERVQEVSESADRDLQKPIEDFINNTPTDKAARDEAHRRLSELVLQRMFLLDDIDVTDNPELRQERKAVINKFHKYHADLDKANEAASK